jgi:hypothetical protein
MEPNSKYLELYSGGDSAILEDEEVKYIDNKEPNRPLSRYNKIRMLLTKSDKDAGLDPVVIQESWDPPTIPVLPNDRYVQVLPEWENRPDILALQFYGSEQLYWIIAYANGMIDPFAETYIGRRLRIPDRENLYHDVLQK